MPGCKERHPANPRVQDIACVAFGRFSKCNADNAAAVMTTGAPACILAAMERHLADQLVQDSACRVLGSLSNSWANDYDNAAALMAAGAPARSWLRWSGTSSTRACRRLQESACGALWALSDNEDNAAALMTAGALARILAAMERHLIDPRVQESACGALWC